MGENKINDYNKLKAEEKASYDYLESQKYLFERKLLNGLGDEINYTLSHPKIYNNRGVLYKLISKIKKIFMK